jgi:hypothetical protein
MSSRYLPLLLAACFLACSPAKPKGPQPAGVNSRAFVGDAEIELRYRYEPQVGKEIVLYVDATGKSGSVGAVRMALELDGFTVVRGKPSWQVDVGSGRTETQEVTLRATDGVPRVTVVTRHVERDVELASDDMRFWVDEDDMVAECEPSVEACK